MREETVMVRARWTSRRVRLWALLLHDLVAAAVRQLGVDVAAVVAVEVEDPGEHCWSRRRWVLVRVRVLYLETV